MSAPAGWYPDPTAPPGASTSPTPPLRWWDGANWTEHTHGGAGPTSGEWRQPGWQQPAPWGRQGGDAPGTAGYGSAAGAYAGGYDASPRARLLATPDGQQLGGLGRRLLARIVDALLIQLVVVVAAWGQLRVVADAFQTYLDQVVVAAQAGATTAPPTDAVTGPGVVSALNTVSFVAIAVSAVYTVLFLRFVGATPGKLLLGLRVRGWDRPGLPGWGQAVLRWVTRDLVANVPVAGQAYWFLDSLWPLWDTRRQALHDKLGRTVVVRARR
ncbi:RDD family protein [Kineococcus rubinsiae]|uniref:RDD family protein n=1 Tax=Kineococcus rubinsiae TaxID=2609562 RepID=UPI00143170DE|nr:RDD family protein [Kineococcus rubinsiae]NIZ90829.1 RDD family protein [Kineococcus rubinsiae]